MSVHLGLGLCSLFAAAASARGFGSLIVLVFVSLIVFGFPRIQSVFYSLGHSALASC